MNKIATYEEIRDLNRDAVLIDVREISELEETGAIPKSINIPLGTLEEVLSNMSHEDFIKNFGCSKPTLDQEVIFSCRLGGRAQKAMQCALNVGYKNARFYKGSWEEWAKKSKE